MCREISRRSRVATERFPANWARYTITCAAVAGTVMPLAANMRMSLAYAQLLALDCAASIKRSAVAEILSKTASGGLVGCLPIVAILDLRTVAEPVLLADILVILKGFLAIDN